MKKLYTNYDLEKMEALKKELEETGEGERFTTSLIQRRLRVGEERAIHLFNSLKKVEEI